MIPIDVKQDIKSLNYNQLLELISWLAKSIQLGRLVYPTDWRESIGFSFNTWNWLLDNDTAAILKTLLKWIVTDLIK